MQSLDALNQILKRADIVDIARRLGMQIGRVEPKLTKALCPFHDDRSPSLALYTTPGNPHFNCFACGAQGGLLDLVERQRRTTKAESFRWLAEVVGVTLSEQDRRGPSVVEALGVESFADWLQAHNQPESLAEFATARKIDEAILIDSGVVVVDMAALKPSQLSPAQRETFERIGVLVRRRDKLVPVVSGRQVVFPITGESFIFRTHDETGLKASRYRFPKGFKKSEVLFGYDSAAARLAENPTDGLFVVEGVMDALRLRSSGFAVVAVLGASVSPRQAALVLRLTAANPAGVAPIHLFFDGDEPGRRAVPSASRALLVGHESLSPLDVIYPDVEGDPDDLLQELPPLEARAKISGWTISLFEALARHYTGRTSDTGVLADLTTGRPLLRVELLRYVAAQLGSAWREIRDLADPDGVYLGESRRLERSWLHEALDVAGGLESVSAARPAQAYAQRDEEDEDAELRLRRALRIAQSSNFRREYPFDWGGMTRLSLAANATTEVAKVLLKDRSRRPVPYAARFVPKDEGRVRLKAGPWPEDALLQQYVLSDLLRARHETPGWYLDTPAVRFIRSGKSGPVFTGPEWLRPVGPPDQPSPVVSFAYQIDQQIVEGEAPPRREGMFVPYRECWKQFTEHLDGFVAQQAAATNTFYAVRLDITGFFDNIPRHAVEDVLKRALQEGAARHFAGRDFRRDMAPLFDPGIGDGEAGNRNRAGALSQWLLNQSFGYQYFDPANGALRSAPNATLGVPQGPDLSAYLSNLALFPLDRAVTRTIEGDRLNASPDGKGAARATYGRYVDDLVIITTDESLLNSIEATIGIELRTRGLAMNAKHDRARSMTRRQIREWLLGEHGAAVLVSVGGEESPSTTRSGVAELIELGPDTRRSDVLQLLHSDELYAPTWSVHRGNVARIHDAVRRLRGLGGLDLRYYDWVSAARWVIHSLINSDPDLDQAKFAKVLLETWRDLYGQDTARPVFGEDPLDVQARQTRLTTTPLLILFDAIERSIDSRHDRRGQVEEATRQALRNTRIVLTGLLHDGDLCGRLLTIAAADAQLASVLSSVENMLRIQRLSILGLAATINRTPSQINWQPEAEPRTSYVHRRFLLNAMGADIRNYLAPISQEIEQVGEAKVSPEAEPLLLFHEAVARLQELSPDPTDPLQPISDTTLRTLRLLTSADVGVGAGQLDAPRLIVGLVARFLETPGPDRQGPGDDRVLRSFVEIIAGKPEGLNALSRRTHLVRHLTQNGELLGVPPGVDSQAFFVFDGDAVRALAFNDEQGPNLGDEKVFGLETGAPITDDGLARYICTLPVGYDRAQPVGQRLNPSDITPADLREFAKAYADLAVEHARALADVRLDGAADLRPISPLHLLRPENPAEPWKAFGAVAALPVGSQAFVRLGPDRLHSIAVYANGAHLWQVGFALADHMGYRGFARSSELDRLTVQALEPTDGVESIPFYLMQLIVPRLCGAFMGRSRSRIDPGDALPGSVVRQLDRLQKIAGTEVGSTSHIAELFEAGAEARAGDILKETPAPLQIPGSLSAVFRAVGRAAGRSEKIFTRNLPEAAPPRPTHRRNVDLWISAASRLDAVSGLDASVGLRTASAAIKVGALGKLAQNMALEVWALLSDEDRLRFRDFVPVVGDLDLPDELLLVTREHSQRAPTAEDQALRLMDALVQRATAGATARAALDRVTPLGWVVALATVSGLVSLDPLPFDEENGDPARPRLLAVRNLPSELKVLPEEDRLRKALVAIAAYLAQPAEEDAANALHESDWPWSAFQPLVDGAAEALSILTKALPAFEALYGLRSKTLSSRFFQMSDSDDRGYSLVTREDGGRANIGGWQIDRDSLGLSRVGDLEVKTDETGARSFVWSETKCEDRLIGLSIAYRSLAEFAGALDETEGAPTAGAQPATPSDPIAVVEQRHEADLSVLDDVVEADRIDQTRAEPVVSPVPLSSPGNDDALQEVRALWDAQWRRNNGQGEPFRSVAVRVALLQMNIDQIGHSFSHPICEVLADTYSKWDQTLVDIRSGNRSNELSQVMSQGRGLSKAEAWRRAILTEALERCKLLNVELLVLPEYGLRPDTVSWLARELEARADRTSVLAGTFRHAARAAPLDYTTGVALEHSLGAIVPLVVPSGAFPAEEGRQRSKGLIFSRLKKYPSVGLSEFIRPESGPLQAVYEAGIAAGMPIPDRLKYMRDLVCSEVFLTMSPANIYSTVPVMLDLRQRFGDPVTHQTIVANVLKDIDQMGQETSQAIFRGLTNPRKTIIAVPAATTRPFDHHVFGEAGAKAAGLVTVFSNMAGDRRGKSCFIGHYKTVSVDGSHIWGLQSPYHGRAPGIWTYDFPGGKPLGAKETALVVADLNPIDTNPSQPARQIENLPLSLVAHIPFFLGGPARVETRARDIAAKIAAFLRPPDTSDSAKPVLSSCEIDIARAGEAYSLACELAGVDDRCSGSLQLRAEGLRVGSMQPTTHPRIPALVDWAFVREPPELVMIEVPPIEGVEATSLGEEA